MLRALIRDLGRIDQSQLRLLATAVTIDRQRAGEMDAGAPRAQQRLAERLADDAERDRLDRRALGGDRAQPKMLDAGREDADQTMTRQREHRLGIAGAERSRRLDRLG